MCLLGALLASHSPALLSAQPITAGAAREPSVPAEFRDSVGNAGHSIQNRHSRTDSQPRNSAGTDGSRAAPAVIGCALKSAGE